MKNLFIATIMVVALTACSSTDEGSSSAKADTNATKDDCAGKEYLARQECLSAKLK